MLAAQCLMTAADVVNQAALTTGHHQSGALIGNGCLLGVHCAGLCSWENGDGLHRLQTEYNENCRVGGRCDSCRLVWRH